MYRSGIYLDRHVAQVTAELSTFAASFRQQTRKKQKKKKKEKNWLKVILKVLNVRSPQLANHRSFRAPPANRESVKFHFRVSTKTESLRPWLGKQVEHIKYGKEGENKSC